MLPPSFSIALEEHAMFPSLEEGAHFYDQIWKVFPEQRQRLMDHSTVRIADMDKGHVSFQVMSHLPGIGMDRPDDCVKANDEMAEAIQKNPDRFAGFAALPMAYPERAAKELERAVKELGFVGAMIDNHLPDMTHYDAERFWVVFEMAERLDVPLYIHPAPMTPEAVKQRYEGNYPDVAAQGMATGGWGWHENVGQHTVKLYAAGVFARFPKLKIIIGHMGEVTPIMIDRLDDLTFFKHLGFSKFSEVWDRNIWVTSSGIFSVRTLEMVLKVTKKDRVMYSIDTPFKDGINGWNYLQELAESNVLSKEDLDNFAFGNAKRLLKLDVNLKEM